MYPTYKDGDIVKVEKQESYNDGDVVVADVGRKKVIKRINGDVLEGDNKENTARYNLKTADILGKAEYGTDQLTDEQKAEFEKVFASGVEMVSAGSIHTVVLRSDGTVWAWGYNGYGNLGDGTNTERHTPVQVHGVNDMGFLTDVSQVFTGTAHTVALRSNGTVCVWGWNKYGQLGNTINNGVNTANPIPMQIESLEGVIQISAGQCHTVALMNDGTIYAWGYNAYGQLGNINNIGTDNPNPIPVKVEGLTGVSQISAVNTQTIALMNNGTVYAWGRNQYGQLGNVTNCGTDDPNPTPLEVEGLTGVVQVSTNGAHTVALKDDGTVYAWGYNRYGQLGNATNSGTNTPTPTPLQVTEFMGVIQVIAGGYYTVALKADGTVWAWGRNNHGQLGNATNSGTDTPNRTPLQVDGLIDISQISAGIDHTVAIKNDGTVYAWGNNEWGKLGDNTIISRTIPALIVGEEGVGFFNVDSTSPDVTITSSPVSPTTESSVTYTFEFTENVENFDIGDITVGNGDKGAFNATDGDTYTLVVNKVADGDQIITVAAGACQDAAGNLNTEGTITVLMTTIITSPGYSLGTVIGDKKWFKYYLGKAAVSGVTKAMLVAPKDGDGVKRGTFTKGEIIDINAGPNQYKFLSGQIYYIDREGKIQLYGE